jgi:hypothetical protein
MKKTVYVEELDKDVEVDIDIELDDVIDYISYDADRYDEQQIADELSINVEPDWDDIENYISHADKDTKKDIIDLILGKGNGNYVDNTLAGEMKEEWWVEARKKYSLQELEDRLGNKFQM